MFVILWVVLIFFLNGDVFGLKFLIIYCELILNLKCVFLLCFVFNKWLMCEYFVMKCKCLCLFFLINLIVFFNVYVKWLILMIFDV